jgi:transposase
LFLGAVDLERKYYHTWETRLKSWKELKTEEAVQGFMYVETLVHKTRERRKMQFDWLATSTDDMHRQPITYIFRLFARKKSPSGKLFPLGEFVRANREKRNLIGWRQTLTTSPTNHSGKQV